MEAQNVPRVVEALRSPVTSLSLVPVAGASLLAWSTPEAVRVMALDARGVPRAPASVALEQPGTRSVGLDPAERATLRVDAIDPSVEPWVLTLQPDGAVASRARWPIGALGPVRLGGVAFTAQINPLGSPMLLRSSVAAAGKVWGIFMPKVQIGANPSDAAINAIHGAQIKFQARVPDDAGTTTIASSKILLAIG